MKAKSDITSEDGRSRVGSGATVGALFRSQAKAAPQKIAIEFDGRHVTYADLLNRVDHLTALLSARGVQREGRIAVLSENCIEYVEVILAAGQLGALVGCQNWRMATAELQYCLNLLSPEIIFVSSRFKSSLERTETGSADVLEFGEAYEEALARLSHRVACCNAAPEDGLTVIYTSGTTGVPKGAVISHRAMLARAMTNRIDHPCDDSDNFVAWAPMFHIASTDAILATLMRGAKVVLQDGFVVDAFAGAVSRETISHLMIMPGVITSVIEEFARRKIVARARYVGVTADLVPPEQLRELTTLLNTPYCNSFGSTETGWPPFSKSLIPVGVAPQRLSKRKSSYCVVKLVDTEGREVEDGEPGEVLFSGPTLFSGYLGDERQGGLLNDWYAMGDIFVRNADDTYDFVDRSKYLIKSGGENIYPAEIERILLAHPKIRDAAVVRMRDHKWGEIPIAFVVRREASLTSDEVLDSLKGRLATYKMPRTVLFVDDAEFSRGENGKLDRRRLEMKAQGSGDADC